MNLFQTPEWEKFKLATGWQKSYRVSGILVLERKIPHLGSMLYSPMIGKDQISKIKDQNFKSKIKELAKENGVIFFRHELDIPTTENINPAKFGFIKSFEEMQPEHTLILDINRSEEEILAQMKPKGRYNIKVAEKHGVEISAGTALDFYKLYATMAERQHITFRSKSYFEKLVEILGNDLVKVYIAESKDSEIIASAIVAFYGERATYLFGGSSNENRELMAPYKLQWEIIKEAKRRNCKEYDFFGIAPNDNPKHPWAGVSRFKKQFGGQEVHNLGSWDLIFSPLKYKLFRLVEKARRHK
ncbi:MAG: peptidoglycan bridge formation glycyltransferase FemA/FemB family protein [Candidatus Berkelbacteria bacterium]|nr:peptidoglycan bridge formation glycyltransferase FemA/FemB family protein [Candidatus Berkelbacteria bacterium]